MRSAVPLLLAVAFAAASADDAPPPGMDVLPLVRAAANAISPPPPPVAGRTWSDDLAALTDSNPTVSGPAMGRLARRGAVVLPDLAVLASDRDPQVRARVVRVAAVIGGTDGAPLVLRLSGDADPQVRRSAILGLGLCRGDPVLARLLELLRSFDPEERCAAAPALAGLGDVRAIEALTRLRTDADVPARDAQKQALRQLLARPDATPVVAGLLGKLTGEQRWGLLEGLDGAVDTRLCPALTALIGDRDALTCLLAVRCLATAGDQRAVEPLVRLTTSRRMGDLCEAAATSLRQLTGYRASAGAAWTLWWDSNSARVVRLAERDALVAQLMDPGAPLPAGLSAFEPAELTPLVDAVAAAGRQVPTWFPARAMAALRAQDGRPWIPFLVGRIDAESDGDVRLDLLVLLDELGGAGAADAFAGLAERLEKREAEALKLWKDKGLVPPDTAAERAVIALARERQR